MKTASINRTRGSTKVVQLSQADAPFGHVYAIGRIHHFFPAMDIRKEYLQLLQEQPPGDPSTEDQSLQQVLKQHPFLAREMGWSFLIGNVETYHLSAAAPDVLDQLVTSICPKDPALTTYDVIVGAQEPTLSSELPGVAVNWTFQFTLQELAVSVVATLRKQGVQSPPSKEYILGVFDDMLQLANNAGDADEHRALNYVSVNYPDVYIAQGTAQEQTSQAPALFAGVETRRSELGGGRTIIDVILRFQSQSTGLTTRYFTSVDVSGQFPFLVAPLGPYFER
jgi:hypothetical protein